MKHRESRTGGFTVVELVGGAALCVVLILGFFSVLDSGRTYVERGARIAEVESQARRLAQRIAQELENSGVGTLVPVDLGTLEPAEALFLGTRDLTFRSNQDFSGGTIQWGPPARIFASLEPGELDNGIDDDGDGLVDEGRLAFQRDTADPPVAWASGVAEFLEGEVGGNALDDNGNGLIDEPGLCLSLIGRVLTIRLTIERPERGGPLVRDTSETSVLLRNP